MSDQVLDISVTKEVHLGYWWVISWSPYFNRSGWTLTRAGAQRKIDRIINYERTRRYNAATAERYEEKI